MTALWSHLRLYAPAIALGLAAAAFAIGLPRTNASVAVVLGTVGAMLAVSIAENRRLWREARRRP